MLEGWARGRPRDGESRNSMAMRAYATRLMDRVNKESYPDVIAGASPRGLLKLIRAIHAEALINGSTSPQNSNLLLPTWGHVREVAPDVLRHRIRLSSSAVAMGVRPETVIEDLLEWVGERP
jgi:hypothetical protein